MRRASCARVAAARARAAAALAARAVEQRALLRGREQRLVRVLTVQVDERGDPSSASSLAVASRPLT